MTSVEAFTRATNPVESALEYPGLRPEGSFLTDGSQITELPNTYNEFAEATDAYLKAHDLPSLEDRVPVLAYGSNASPARLRDKIAKYGATPELLTVPHIVATSPNTLAVWHGKPGQTGSIFAELYNGPEAERASLTAHVAFMTRKQLAIIHASEGATYSAAELPVKMGVSEDDQVRPVLAYVALKSKVLLQDGKPVLVDGLQHNNTDLPSLSAPEAVNYILEHTAVDAAVPTEPQAYVGEGLELTLTARKARQARVAAVLTGLGLAREFGFAEKSPEQLIGRADFTSIPGNQDKYLYHIPEMILPADLAHKVSARALVELSERTGLPITKSTPPIDKKA
jgi:hypothetical protein